MDRVNTVIDESPFLLEIGEEVNEQVWKAHYPMDKSCMKIENKRVFMDRLMEKLKAGEQKLREELKESNHEKDSIKCALELILKREGSTAYNAGYGTMHGNVAWLAAQNLVSKFQVDAGKKWARNQVWPWPGARSADPPIMMLCTC